MKQIKEFIGDDKIDAYRELSSMFPEHEIELLPDGAMVSTDYLTRRIRIFYDRVTDYVTLIVFG